MGSREEEVKQFVVKLDKDFDIVIPDEIIVKYNIKTGEEYVFEGFPDRDADFVCIRSFRK